MAAGKSETVHPTHEHCLCAFFAPSRPLAQSGNRNIKQIHKAETRHHIIRPLARHPLESIATDSRCVGSTDWRWLWQTALASCLRGIDRNSIERKGKKHNRSTIGWGCQGQNGRVHNKPALLDQSLFAGSLLFRNLSHVVHR